jgi:hypothetical protein
MLEVRRETGCRKYKYEPPAAEGFLPGVAGASHEASTLSPYAFPCLRPSDQPPRLLHWLQRSLQSRREAWPPAGQHALLRASNLFVIRLVKYLIIKKRRATGWWLFKSRLYFAGCLHSYLDGWHDAQGWQACQPAQRLHSRPVTTTAGQLRSPALEADAAASWCRPLASPDPPPSSPAAPHPGIRAYKGGRQPRGIASRAESGNAANSQSRARDRVCMQLRPRGFRGSEFEKFDGTLHRVQRGYAGFPVRERLT